MSLEKRSEREPGMHGLEGGSRDPNEAIEEVTLRVDEVGGKIESQVGGITRAINELPPDSLNFFRDKAGKILKGAQRSLSLAQAGAIVALALNAAPTFANDVDTASPENKISTEQATKKTTEPVQPTNIIIENKAPKVVVEVASDIPESKNENEDPSKAARPSSEQKYVEAVMSATRRILEAQNNGGYLEAATDAVGIVGKARIDSEVENFKEKINELGNIIEKPQKTIDAALSIATDTPILGRAVLKKFPILNIIATLNDLQRDLRDPNKKPEDVMKSLGRALLDAKTFGLGSLALDFIIKKQNPVIAEVEKEYGDRTAHP